MTINFLPTSKQEMQAHGWDSVDIILVTGDAYIDHPSFGVALIGRWLEAHGYRVAILSQPRYQNAEDFTTFGRPRLFFGITSGNLDSIVANYSGNARVRESDSYSPGGNPYFNKDKNKQNRRRPDRATILYSNLARAAYKDVPVILGGMEASLRRFIHFDYQQNRLRGSILTDAKADLLVYGMGERAVLEIARRLEQERDLSGIPGTSERMNEAELNNLTKDTNPLILPSWQDIQNDKKQFMEAELAIDKHARALSSKPAIQEQQSMWVLQNQPAAPLSPRELDQVYDLPFRRQPHPTAGNVPAYEMIKDSVTIVRGCCGNCSFCAIARHQGPVVTSRSPKSILEEIHKISVSADFRGTISDLGGPTANLYGTGCASPKPCNRHDCLYPKICRHLQINEKMFLDLLHEVLKIEGVKHAFISSGLRMELLLETPKLLEQILDRHTPGAMKIAPEHTDNEVLRLMHKPGSQLLDAFLQQCKKLAAQRNKEIQFSPYFISSHPGCTDHQMQSLATTIKKHNLKVRQFQDFTPTPGTLSTAMYVTGLDRDTLAPIHVARNRDERRKQRTALESIRPLSNNAKKKRAPKKAPFKKNH
jgi:uncharacterized radical SAM protein YgiQ